MREAKSTSGSGAKPKEHLLSCVTFVQRRTKCQTDTSPAAVGQGSVFILLSLTNIENYDFIFLYLGHIFYGFVFGQIIIIKKNMYNNTVILQGI